ncbi:hypothetical protein [Sphaerisporangium fuscum]|uniref:hypothetical protein n=1 Tax=Sphaerisporangium fuscum TaxID=2835868 RepID=UPI001BDCBE68|nr:hypothetical protein [Sphaerisporangium fuscum]
MAPMKAQAAAGRGPSLLRWTVLAAIGLYLLLPLVATLEFSTRGVGRAARGRRGMAIGTDPDLLDAIVVSLELVLLTVVGMLVPTMAWVHLRVPRLRRAVEFACLLPLTLSPIVLVVGISPIYARVTYVSRR